MKFVITGTLSQGRSAIASRVKRLGGHVMTAVSNQTDYVVAGPDVLGTNKLDKARRIGVPVIREAKMWRLLGASSLSRAPKLPAAARPVPLLRIYNHNKPRRSGSGKRVSVTYVTKNGRVVHYERKAPLHRSLPAYTSSLSIRR